MKFDGKILFRCDGTVQLGLGHLSRCAVIAQSLARDRCLFAVKRSELAERFLGERSLPFENVPEALEGAAEGALLVEMARAAGADVVVLDARDNAPELVPALKEAGLTVVDFEDRGPGRSLADLLVDSHLQPGSAQAEYDGNAICGFGPAWAILHPRYGRLHRQIVPPVAGALVQDDPLTVAVSLGGTDPSGLTLRVLKVLERCEQPLRIEVVLGPGAGLERFDSSRHELHFRHAPKSLAPILYRSGLAVVSGGITMFESLCLGLPTVVAPQHEEQFHNASRLASRGALLVIPPPSDPSFAIGLEVVLKEMLQDQELRVGLSCRAWSVVDGSGLERLWLALNRLLSRNLAAAG